MIKIMSDRRKVIVVGGGAAGLMAAISAAKCDADVVLCEKNDRPGKKLRITGKGRCNVTNDCDVQEFLKNVPTNSRFLYGAINRFSTEDTKNFFERAGVPLKVERGKRVFPMSDKAQDIVDALVKECNKLNVKILHKRVISLSLMDASVTGVVTDDGTLFADSVVVATGGMSYRQTGSDGDGYRFAKQVGLKVTELLPSLVPIVSDDNVCTLMQGLSLKNVALKIVNKTSNKVVYSDFGEMMFTHFGITGPMVLSASAHVPDINTASYEAQIDLKPALDEKKLDVRILNDFAEFSNRNFANSLNRLLPQKMIDVVVKASGISPYKKVNSVTKEERAKLLSIIKCFKINLKGFRPLNEAIITKGGVDVKQIMPNTMRAKTIKNLYFAGEVLDVDAYTGGFNLQIAFSTAVVAGESAAIGE